MSQYTSLSTPDPEFAAAIASVSVPNPPPDLKAIRKSINTLINAGKKVTFPETQLKVQDWKVTVHNPLGEISVQTYVAQPTSKDHANPLLFWIHGGGFVVGGLGTNENMLKKLAVEMGLSIVNVDYRLAPEYPFPVGLNDTYEALKWASLHAQELHADLAKGFLIGGGSTGGQFTAVLAHRARDDPLLRGKITGQILQIPTVVVFGGVPGKYKHELQSVEQNKDAPFLDKRMLEFFFDSYGVTNSTDPDASPLLFGSHKDLPPAYLQICGLDPLRDEGLLYEKVLREEGVRTRLDIYPGVPHGFQLYFPELEQSSKWHKDVTDGIRWLLRGDI